MIQIRNVPDELHARPKSRAARAYDAAYIGLAEALNAPLATADTHLADAPGHRALIELV